VNGERNFDFSSAIYNHDDVRDTLKKAQHDKCCYCEAKFCAAYYGDIEHFRPKGGFQQSKLHKIEKPGYYWLAYNWDNLYFSCALCNQKHKKNFFPLKDPASRVRCHKDDLRKEEPLLLDPGGTEPEQHISFRAEIAYAIDSSPEGCESIELLGLNRDPLCEDRLSHLAMLKRIFDLKQLIQGEKREEAERFLRNASESSGQFASSVRAAIRTEFAWVKG
jgi:uncharacterized protein (TIGR02646 family)